MDSISRERCSIQNKNTTTRQAEKRGGEKNRGEMCREDPRYLRSCSNGPYRENTTPRHRFLKYPWACCTRREWHVGARTDKAPPSLPLLPLLSPPSLTRAKKHFVTCFSLNEPRSFVLSSLTARRKSRALVWRWLLHLAAEPDPGEQSRLLSG